MCFEHCVCVLEREEERENVRACVCVCMCMCKREGEIDLIHPAPLYLAIFIETVFLGAFTPTHFL